MRKFLLLVLLAICFSSSGVVADTVPIANKNVIENKLTVSDVRALYLLKYRRWSSGEKVILFQMPVNSAEHRSFVHEVLGMSMSEYDREWNRVVSDGLSSDIHTVRTADDMMNRVKNTPNAIGYISNDTIIINSGANDVTILHITY